MTLRVPRNDGRVSILYLAPWVDFGGSDKGTIDWFRWMDRDRFRVSLVTTQPSPNRRMADIEPYADEVWPLPEMAQGDAFPSLVPRRRLSSFTSRKKTAQGTCVMLLPGMAISSMLFPFRASTWPRRSSAMACIGHDVTLSPLGSMPRENSAETG